MNFLDESGGALSAEVRAFEALVAFERRSLALTHLRHEDDHMWPVFRFSCWELLRQHFSTSTAGGTSAFRRRLPRFSLSILMAIRSAVGFCRLVFRRAGARGPFLFVDSSAEARRGIHNVHWDDPSRRLGLQAHAEVEVPGTANQVFQTLTGRRHVIFADFVTLAGLAARIGWRLLRWLRLVGIPTGARLPSGGGEIDRLLQERVAELWWPAKLQRTLWSLMLGALAPRVIVEIAAYGIDMGTLNQAARRRNPRTVIVEVQHGIIHRQHAGYAYPDGIGDAVSPFPDFIATNGSYYSDVITSSSNGHVLRPMTFGMFRLLRHSSSRSVGPTIHQKLTIPSGTPIVVITTTGKLQQARTLARFLAKAEAARPANANFQWIVKLHPSEEKGRVEWPASAKVVQDDFGDIYDLLGEASAHATMFSTVLIEASRFPLRNWIIPLGGFDWPMDLVRLGMAEKVDGPEDFVTRCANLGQKAPSRQRPSIEFFGDSSRDQLELFYNFLASAADSK